jgi:hypothetical protein
MGDVALSILVMSGWLFRREFFVLPADRRSEQNFWWLCRPNPDPTPIRRNSPIFRKSPEFRISRFSENPRFSEFPDQSILPELPITVILIIFLLLNIFKLGYEVE